MSDPNNDDAIGDAPDADPELTRNRSGAGGVWRVAASLVVVVLVIVLIVVFL